MLISTFSAVKFNPSNNPAINTEARTITWAKVGIATRVDVECLLIVLEFLCTYGRGSSADVCRQIQHSFSLSQDILQ
jgi:hypothetical protein